MTTPVRSSPRTRTWFAVIVASAGLVACGPRDRATPTDRPTRIDSGSYDVIVVGGGLAGLTAASALHGRRVLVLERTGELGGRVRTRNRDATYYELGALFAYDPRWLPSGESPSVSIPGHVGVGFSEAGATTIEPTAIGLVDRLETSVDGSRTERAAARRALFGIVHPGRFDDYLPERRDDWRSTFSSMHEAHGNVELVQALARRSEAEVRLGATVTTVTSTDEAVRVEFEKDGTRIAVSASVAIVATPADVAARILGEALPADSPVRRVRYAPGIVAVLGIRTDAVAPFGYVVSEDSALSGVFSSESDGRRILTVYFAREDADALRDADDATIVARAIEALARLGVGSPTRTDVSFSEVARWPTLGTIIAHDPYDGWSAAATRPTERIFLAGDYTHWDARRMPYGMHAAVASGRAAAEAVRASSLLAADATTDRPASPSVAERARIHGRVGLPPPPDPPWRLAPLTSCEVYELGADAPEYVGRLDEGSIAPYGIVLLDEHDPDIVGALLEARRENGWEYSPRYGATAADTAMALEGLVDAGIDPAIAIASLDALRDRYLDVPSGGFRTVERGGRASYWVGPSPDTTALVATSMQTVAADRYATEIEGAARYLLRSQADDGLWRGRWFPSWAMTTSYALRVLARRQDPDGAASASIERAVRALVALQREDGSLAGSVSETAHLAIALHAAGADAGALSRARRWLETRAARRESASGDPVLYYWFDEPEGGRAFFTCRDRGRLAESWANAALRRTRPPG